MYSSYNNCIENIFVKRALFALLLSKFDRVGCIPGNEQGVISFVSFLLLVLVLVCSYMYSSLNLVDSGKKKKSENYHIPGRDLRHPDSASFVGRRVEELKYVKGPNIGLVYKARIYYFDKKTPIKQKERLGRGVYLRTSGFSGLWGPTRS